MITAEKEEEKQRCQYELIVEEYFGYKMTKTDKVFSVDDTQLTNLVCFAHQKFNSEIKEESEESLKKIIKEWEDKIEYMRSIVLTPYGEGAYKQLVSDLKDIKSIKRK